jgi:hypothetical protein
LLKQVSKHVPFRVVAAVAPTLLRHDSQQTEKMRREIQNPELLPTQVRFSMEQSTLGSAQLKVISLVVPVQYSMTKLPGTAARKFL